jgi:hypothetical protein
MGKYDERCHKTGNGEVSGKNYVVCKNIDGPLSRFSSRSHVFVYSSSTVMSSGADDGPAMGATARTAVEASKREKPKQLILVVAVAPEDAAPSNSRSW